MKFIKFSYRLATDMSLPLLSKKKLPSGFYYYYLFPFFLGLENGGGDFTARAMSLREYQVLYKTSQFLVPNLVQGKPIES